MITERKVRVLFTIVAFFWTGVLCGQIATRFDGLVFADYYYISSSHDAVLNDQNAFSFRRIYFTFENNLTQKIKIRFRIESAHEDFGTAAKINPFVKHAFLEWTDLIPRHKLYLGIAETNALKNAEIYWGYRSIEKTILDLNKISPSADMGIVLKGDLGRYVHHWITVFNGTGYGSSEVDKYKKIGYALWLTPFRGLIIEGYVDYEKQDPGTGTFAAARDYFHSTGYYTLKGFLGYKASRFAFGIETFLRINKESGSTDAAGTTKTDVTKRGMSFFGSCMTPIPKIRIFARYDIYDPNIHANVWISETKSGTDDEYSLIIAGLDFNPREKIHLMPNILIKTYVQEGKSKDVTFRMTLYYSFDSGKIVI